MTFSVRQRCTVSRDLRSVTLNVVAHHGPTKNSERSGHGFPIPATNVITDGSTSDCTHQDTGTGFLALNLGGLGIRQYCCGTVNC